MCVTRNKEIIAYDQPPISNDGDFTIVVDDGTVVRVDLRNVEHFKGGEAPVVVFMGSAAINGVKYSITTGIQAWSSEEGLNSIHMILREKENS